MLAPRAWTTSQSVPFTPPTIPRPTLTAKDWPTSCMPPGLESALAPAGNITTAWYRRPRTEASSGRLFLAPGKHDRSGHGQR